MTAMGNAHAVPVLVRLGVFDRLAERPRSVEELAEATGTDAAALARVMALCRCLNLVSESGGTLRLTELGGMLVRGGDAPSFGDGAALRGAPAYHERWASLESVLRGGPRSAADVDLYALERARVAEAHRAALADYAAGFGRSERYVDVESGDPGFLAAILKMSGRSEGVYVGKADELARAKAVLSAAGVAHRCELVLPEAELPAGDAYLLSHRLEALGDDDAVALLSRARRAMNRHGRVLVIGHVLQGAHGRLEPLGAMIDLEMLLLTPAGKVRSDEELRVLCERASLEPRRTILAGQATRVVEAAAAPLG